MKTQASGIFLGLISGFFWGCMDVAAQYLLHNAHMTPAPFVSLTMTVSAVCMFFALVFLQGRKSFAPLMHIRDFGATLVFAFFILGAEVTFFSCIKFSNASTAAVLAATRPFWIMGILATFAAILPSWKQILCGVTAVAGVVLLVTQGHVSEISLHWLPLICGLGAAVASACYTVQSQGVISRTGPFSVLLWGMVFGAIAAISIILSGKTTWNGIS